MYVFRRIQQETNLTDTTSFVNVYQAVGPSLAEFIRCALFNARCPSEPVGEPKVYIEREPDQERFPGCVFRVRAHYRFHDDFEDKVYMERMDIRVYNVTKSGYSPSIVAKPVDEQRCYSSGREFVKHADVAFDRAVLE